MAGFSPAAGLAWTHPAAQFVAFRLDVHRCSVDRARLGASSAFVAVMQVGGYRPQLRPHRLCNLRGRTLSLPYCCPVPGWQVTGTHVPARLQTDAAW